MALAAPSSSWVWPLGQDPSQWSSLLSALQGQGVGGQQISQQNSSGSGIPGVTTPSENVPGVPGVQRQSPSATGGQGTAQQLALSKLFLGTGKNAANLTGLDQQANQALGNLFGGGTSVGSGFSIPSSGFSLSGGEGFQGIPSSGLSLSGEPASGFNIDPSGLSLGGAGTGQLGSAGSGLNYLGGATAGAGLGISLASLINSIVNGQASEGQYAQALVGLLASAPSLVETTLPLALGTTAAGLGLGGLGGLGLATTPMLIPAIMSIIDMFKEPSFPYSSKNVSQYKSRYAADTIPKQLNDYLLTQNNPLQLIGMATGATPLSPSSEVLFRAGGENWGSPEYNSMLQGMLNGDPQATQRFLRSVEITSGETGGVHNVNTAATDTYRRQLAHALGLTPDQVSGMFPTSAPDYGDRIAQDIQGAIYNDQQIFNQTGSYDPMSRANLQDLMNKIPSYAETEFSGPGHYSPYYQSPTAFRLQPTDVSGYQDLLRTYLQGSV